MIDKTRVTCLRWVPGSSSLFLAAHASGQLYVYNEELPCGSAMPHYQPFKAGEGMAGQSYILHRYPNRALDNYSKIWTFVTNV